MKKIYFFIVSIFIGNQLLNGQPTSQTFNSSGTYTVPAGFSAVVTIEAWGAGAGGGSGAAERGGGGGGAYASITTTLSAGGYAVTVGTGGTVGIGGGNSSFTGLVIAAGGSSTTTITGGAGGTVAASTGIIRFAGGAGGNGATGGGAKGGGGGGGSATSSASGGTGGNGTNNPSNLGGAGGTGTGPGGRGADGGGTPDAVAGTAPGGGGGGRASGGGTSKAGADGRVVVTVTTILPVRLKSFSAVKKNNTVQLQWNAETESNLSGYSIERSYDGANFNAITVVPAKNSGMAVGYNYTDAVAANVVYYRIAINELDGKATFSRIIKVISNGSKNLLVYPNPVRGGVLSFITPDMVKGNYTIKVFNNNAQEVYQMKYTHNGGSLSQQFQLPTTLKPGIYSMQVSDSQVKYQQSFLLQ